MVPTYSWRGGYPWSAFNYDTSSKTVTISSTNNSHSIPSPDISELDDYNFVPSYMPIQS